MIIDSETNLDLIGNVIRNANSRRCRSVAHAGLWSARMASGRLRKLLLLLLLRFANTGRRHLVVSCVPIFCRRHSVFRVRLAHVHLAGNS